VHLSEQPTATLLLVFTTTRLLNAQGAPLELDSHELPDSFAARRLRPGIDRQANQPVLDDEATRLLRALGYLQ
jgi:hypothetical protein